jgi:hypothetical protein
MRPDQKLDLVFENPNGVSKVASFFRIQAG